MITHQNLRVTTMSGDQTNVAPQKGRGAKVDNGTLTASLPPHYGHMIRVKLG